MSEPSPIAVGTGGLTDRWYALQRGLSAGFREAVATSRASWRERVGGRRALLVDLDSVGVPFVRLAPALVALERRGGPFAYMFAAGHPVATRGAWAICARLGVEVLPTHRRRNSADQALLTTAARLHGQGLTEFVIVSGDGDFAALPGTVRVAAFDDAPVSRKLEQRAVTVLRVATR